MHFIKMKIILFGLLLASSSTLLGQQHIELFSLNQVSVTTGIFKEAALTDFKYIQQLNPDRLMAPFLREAGLEPKAESYTNWENTGLDGHTLGHYISALAMYYASTGDIKAKELLDYTLSELNKVQKANGNGYIGGIPGGATLWAEIKTGKINAGSFSLNEKWVPLYNIHKTFNGLKDAWIHTEIPLAKMMLLELTDWFIEITKNLSEAQIQDMLRSEHGGLNEVFAEVYDITRDKKYLKLAQDFSQHALLNPLAENNDILTGMHANTQIPKFIGFERISQLGGAKHYHNAAVNFYDNVTQKRTLTIGGNSVREYFNPITDFSEVLSSEQGPETCNTYNMLKLSKLLFEDTADEAYIDFYERGLYNHILSSQNPDGGFVYFTPMRPGHYRVYSQPETSFWCCVGSGMENHTKYNELIYAKKKDALYVNLFIPSEVKWEEKNAKLIQKTNFPEEATTELIWQSLKKTKATVHLRYPEWVNAGALKVYINGKLQDIVASPGSYIPLERNWKNGDKITMELPMHLSLEQIPDQSGYVSVKYGPIVLAAITGDYNQEGMFADDSRGGHIADGPFLPLTEAPMFVLQSGSSILDQLKPIAGKPLEFRTGGLFYPEKFKNLTLQPFYQIHEKRYSIYFKQETPQGLKAIRQELEEQQKIEAHLRAITVDYIVPGEQQSESDHHIEFERSNTGVHKNKHWRDAEGWFAYDLENKDLEAKSLRITYYGNDDDREFNILVNGELLTTTVLNGEEGDIFINVDYKIPDTVLTMGKVINVRFEAISPHKTAGIYGVRLIKNTP
ncbi:beta-L-arabinofuranosidase domain-containing protein [Leeuwenhoekiella sp. W20_SRS_FM14]|uniref:beta-L-arabinofuranosidase domain-containing protein n=1 Tax=Leeuwenhoekiella sp. W20_SRS_FM14 TaxID=3240270 RepID=UPI003F977857